jgi:hypothetical protein
MHMSAEDLREGLDRAGAEFLKTGDEGGIEDEDDMLVPVHRYQALCELLFAPWRPQEIIDPLWEMVQALGFDAVILVLINQENGHEMLPVVCRGYSAPPTAPQIRLWAETIATDGFYFDWRMLMAASANVDNAVGHWIVGEGVRKFGMAPVRDGAGVLGFMMVATRAESVPPNRLLTPLLELCGGSLGLSIRGFPSAPSVGEPV